MLRRPDDALKDLGNPAIGANYESQLWRAVALARQAKWPEAREKLKNVDFVIPEPADRSAAPGDRRGDAGLAGGEGFRRRHRL